MFRQALRDASITEDAPALAPACAGGDDDACAAGLETIELCGEWESWACLAMGLRPWLKKSVDGELLAAAAQPFTEALRERCGQDRPRPCALLAARVPAGDAERLHTDACTWGYAPSCLIRADTLTGESTAAERQALLKRACDAGLQRGCSGLLREELRSAGETVERLRDGCELQDATSCTAYARAMATSGEPDKARALYEHACDLGDADGCDAAGLLGASIDDDAELFRRKGWFYRACALRGAPSCERAEALERDRALGAELTACRAGQLERCALAVDALATHDPRAASELVAVVLKQSGKACRSSSEACDAIRWIHLITGCGEYGVQTCASRTAAQMRQRRKASAFDARFERLLLAECDRGVASSCQRLASRVTGSSPKRAEKLFLRACELGDATSCGQVRSVGSGYRYMSEDEDYKYIQMACDGGDHESCLGVARYWSDMDPRLSESLRTRARELLEQGCPIGQSPGHWCSTEPILASLAELDMYAAVVDTLRRKCHESESSTSCSTLVGMLGVPRDSWT
ncbi:hypothetical protein OV203_10485 [Nannocystis sp. ILAH1]|uniref:hypothetical protein n=1 Tax=Nannocystis sp. ILAH1 TaxID=2996789 RepID=UPI00226E32F0|nr:hypothetical protein [Nannocystis sp. ILAH1]MCY0987552.1 hypothetical protein [Nannocystis sp. ILAH1]